MAEKQKEIKKKIRKEIENHLFKTFNHLEDRVSSKKLKRNIRRASKILSSGIKKEVASPRKVAKKKTKPANKAVAGPTETTTTA